MVLMRSKTSLLLACCVAAAAGIGCNGSGGDQLMPLKKDATWEYQMRMGLASTVDTWTVIGPARVGGSMGWEMTGPGGSSRLGWSDGTLWAQMLGGTTYLPPIPLVAANMKEAEGVKWQGVVTVASRRYPAKAELTQATEKFKVAGRNLTATRSDLLISMNGKTMSITTWFAPGIGVVRQEERSADQLLRSIEYLRGP